MSLPEGKYLEIDNRLKESIAGSRTFLEYKSAPTINQGTWVELTTFIGTGVKKRRLDFAWPTKLWQDLSTDEVVALVERAAALGE